VLVINWHIINVHVSNISVDRYVPVGGTPNTQSGSINMPRVNFNLTAEFIGLTELTLSIPID